MTPRKVDQGAKIRDDGSYIYNPSPSLILIHYSKYTPKKRWVGEIIYSRDAELKNWDSRVRRKAEWR
jgi:hypothetical protein